MQNKNMINVIVHVYYENGWDNIVSYFDSFKKYDIRLLVNIYSDNIKKNEIYFDIKNKFPESNIISVKNRGKDIGAKLALWNLYLKTNQKSKYFLMIHDKQSPQVFYGEKWKNDLYKIIENNNIEKIIRIFETNHNVGIVCASECISDEYDSKKDEFKSTNNLILKEYIKRFDLKLNDYSFVAGNMFWARSSVYEDFFSKYNPLELRAELEKVNVMDNEAGTRTHSLERVFSWIATSNGYKIFGI